jgi:hypothetical protein
LTTEGLVHRKLAAVAALLLNPLGSWADRPLVSDTADVIDAHACQIETAAARNRSAAANTYNSSALFSCGTKASSQWALGAARDSSDSSRTLLVAGKTTLVMPAPGVTGWGVSYSLTGVDAPERAFAADATTLLMLFTQDLVPGWLLHANLGPSHSRLARQNSTQWTLGVESTTNPTVAADVFGDDHHRPWLSAGAGVSLNERFSINIAAAQQFEVVRVRQWSLGAKLVF